MRPITRQDTNQAQAMQEAILRTLYQQGLWYWSVMSVSNNQPCRN